MIEVKQTECTPAPKSVSSMTTTVAVMQKGMTSPEELLYLDGLV